MVSEIKHRAIHTNVLSLDLRSYSIAFQHAHCAAGAAPALELWPAYCCCLCMDKHCEPCLVLSGFMYAPTIHWQGRRAMRCVGLLKKLLKTRSLSS